MNATEITIFIIIIMTVIIVVLVVAAGDHVISTNIIAMAVLMKIIR